jgi:hypothetical protein
MRLDWKWVGFGVLIMLGLNILAGIILGLVLAPGLEDVSDPTDITLTGGQMALAAILNFLAFFVGGYIVGVKSAGRTILEPALAAAIAVVIGLLLSGNFTLGALLTAVLVPFLAALLGGWLGERRQAQKATPA